MGKRKTILRETILKAINKEPLAEGSWVLYNADGNPVRDPNCQVCAVGAVLRNAGYSNRQIDDFGDMLSGFGPVSPHHEKVEALGAEEVIRELLEDEKYLNALSLKFEMQAERTGAGKRTRKILAKFVKEHFPKRITLDPNAS